MNLNAPVMVLGVAVTVSAVAVSSVAISNQSVLNTVDRTLASDQSLFRELNYSFDKNMAEGFYTAFNTRDVNRNDASKPLLPFVTSSCFDGFFKEVELKRPEQEATSGMDLSAFVPNNFSFGDEEPLMGCKLLKFSKANNEAGFGYMGVTSVQSKRLGMVIYSALTNLKSRETTDAEYWIFFLEKKSLGWTAVNSWRWTLSMKQQVQGGQSPSHKQQSFNAKPTFYGSTWQWSPSRPEETEKFFGTSPDYTQLWGNESQVYSSLWLSGKGEDGKLELLYDGSNERWALREKFNESGVTSPVRFLDYINLKQKGLWVYFSSHCNSLRAGGDQDPTLFDGERNICFSKKPDDKSKPKATK